MRKRMAIFGGAALLVVAGFLGGNYAVLTFFSARPTVQVSEELPSFEFLPPPGRVNLEAAGPVRVPNIEPEVQFFPQRFDSAEFETHLAALETEGDEPATDHELAESDNLAPPQKLPAPADAAPIRDDDAELRDLIARELPGTSREARDIWHDELQGMAPKRARELLELRRLLGPALPPRFAHAPPVMPAVPPVLDWAVPPPPPGAPSEPWLRTEVPPPPPMAGANPYSGGWAIHPHAEAAPHVVPPSPLMDGDMSDWLQPSLAALRQAREVVLNNIANAGTVGFKRSRVVLEDLPYQSVRLPEEDTQGKHAPVGLFFGLGVQVAATQTDHARGPLVKTRQPLDVAIVGEGFFQVQDGHEILYTRNGRLAVNGNGELVLAGSDRGRPLEPAIVIPSEATAVQISSEGTVTVRLPGNQRERVGHIQTARFVNPAGFEPRGETVYAATEAAGPPQVGLPGQEGRGRLHPGALEGANVDLDQELVELKRLERLSEALQRAGSLTTPEPYTRADGTR